VIGTLWVEGVAKEASTAASGAGPACHSVTGFVACDNACVSVCVCDMLWRLQVCRSLLEKDKLLFAFLMTVHLKAHVQHALDWSALRFLLTGGCWRNTVTGTCPPCGTCPP
jgi:hypothetical protein